jgi:hypothetical protein
MISEVKLWEEGEEEGGKVIKMMSNELWRGSERQ